MKKIAAEPNDAAHETIRETGGRSKTSRFFSFMTVSDPENAERRTKNSESRSFSILRSEFCILRSPIRYNPRPYALDPFLHQHLARGARGRGRHQPEADDARGDDPQSRCR